MTSFPPSAQFHSLTPSPHDQSSPSNPLLHLSPKLRSRSPRRVNSQSLADVHHPPPFSRYTTQRSAPRRTAPRETALSPPPPPPSSLSNPIPSNPIPSAPPPHPHVGASESSVCGGKGPPVSLCAAVG